MALPTSRPLVSLSQILTGDSWSEAVARPVLFGWAEYDNSDPDDLASNNIVSNVIAAIYFMSFVIVNSFVLINVVVAVLLDKMVSSDDEEEEEEADDELSLRAIDEQASQQASPNTKKLDAIGEAKAQEFIQRQQDELLTEQQLLSAKVEAMVSLMKQLSAALEEGNAS